jgi:hypothetical protein
MANIGIPKEAIPAFQTLVGLEQKTFNSLLSAFEKSKPTLTPRQFREQISKTVGEVSQAVLWRVLMAVLPLFEIKQDEKLTAKQLADDICLSLKKSKPKGFPVETAELLASRLKQLLELDKSLGVVAKAVDVMTDHEHLFCSSKILSDIRPIFTDTLEFPSAAVIIHNLQIGFHDSATNKHTEFYIALDTDDIQQLKETIARAEKKTLALKSMLTKSNVHYLEP